MSPVSTEPFHHDERIDDGLKMVIQGICDVAEDRESWIAVFLDKLPQCRPCLFRVIAIRIVEEYVFIFEAPKLLKVRVYLEEKALYLRKIKIVSDPVIESGRIRLSEIVRI